MISKETIFLVFDFPKFIASVFALMVVSPLISSRSFRISLISVVMNENPQYIRIILKIVFVLFSMRIPEAIMSYIANVNMLKAVKNATYK